MIPPKDHPGARPLPGHSHGHGLRIQLETLRAPAPRKFPIDIWSHGFAPVEGGAIGALDKGGPGNHR